MVVSALFMTTDINRVNYNNVKIGNVPRKMELFTGFVPGITCPGWGLGVSIMMNVLEL